MSEKKDVSPWSWNDSSAYYQQKVPDVYNLYLLQDTFVIEPLISDTKEFLVIDRVNQNLQVRDSLPHVDGAIKREIYGIVGVINLIAGPYLIVITSRTHLGDINGQGIYRLTKADLISYAPVLNHLNENQLQLNSKYLSMIELVLRTDAFYFSYSYDITHTFQRLHSSPPEFQSIPLIERADQRFAWNRSLLEGLLINKKTAQFALPIIHGFVALETLVLNGHSVVYGVISRRSTARAGTRLFIRGIDDQGHVANFVETEQILQLANVACSYVQTRGSVPCFWSQLPNLRYKPKVAVTPGKNHHDAFRLHFQEQEYYYGRQFLISLTNHHGAEGKLNDKYRELYENSQNLGLKFEDFDFHKECAGMRFDRLTILMGRVVADQDDYGYFAVTKDGLLKSIQTGVFRTNCIDCLDRTNVVQTLLAKRILEIQLRQYSIIKNQDSLDSYKHFSHLFKNIWADNADYISLQYAGTGALKTDYTRTGKRSTMGLVKDGYNSGVRYILNNFFDGFRQDGIDLFLGNYRISSDEVSSPNSSPISNKLNPKQLILPLLLLIGLGMLLINLLLSTQTIREKLTAIVFWAIFMLVFAGAMVARGKQYVNNPRLFSKVKID